MVGCSMFIPILSNHGVERKKLQVTSYLYLHDRFLFSTWCQIRGPAYLVPTRQVPVNPTKVKIKNISAVLVKNVFFIYSSSLPPMSKKNEVPLKSSTTTPSPPNPGEPSDTQRLPLTLKDQPNHLSESSLYLFVTDCHLHTCTTPDTTESQSSSHRWSVRDHTPVSP